MEVSPPRPLRFINHASPASPLHRKRLRLDSALHPSPSTTRTIPVLPDSPYRYNSDGIVVDADPIAEKSRPPPISTAGLDPAAAMLALDAAAHQITKAVREKEQDDKQTKNAYARHIEHYQTYWATTTYAIGDPQKGLAPLPALPITVGKAVIFLRYESTRPQKKRKRKDADDNADESETSSVGVSGLKQAISAMEHWRLNNQHLYKDIPEAQIGLRTDPRIKAFESAASHKEPERVKMAHSLKAKGSSADTYTFEELLKCSVSCLTDSRGPNGIFVDVRDRAMLLTSTSVAFRGDSSRSLLWSDQFLFEVPILAKGLDAKIPALTLIADNAKHNQNGRIEEYGAFRHRHVELCPVGAIATQFFVWFHVLNCAVPDFTPDFTDASYGPFGRREWYEYHVFSHSKQAHKPMSYDNHRDRINLIYAKNNISVSKVTHGGRGYAVKVSREHGASVEGAKALGGWSESGSFRPCYDRALPVDAMLGAAMFDAQRPEAHFLARDSLLPPAELMSALFPWVENEQFQREAREIKNRMTKDIALMHFLRLMVYFRTVIIQDFAILFTKYPSCPIFQYPPFNSPCFKHFAAQSSRRIREVDQQAKLALANLPRTIADTFLGAVSHLSLEQKREQDASKARIQGLDQKLGAMSNLLQHTMMGKKSRTRGEIVVPPPPTSSFIPPPPSIDRKCMYPSQFPGHSTATPPPPLSVPTGASSVYPSQFSQISSLSLPSSSSTASTSQSPLYPIHFNSKTMHDDVFHSPSDFCPGPPILLQPVIESPSIASTPLSETNIVVGGIEIKGNQLAAWAKLAEKWGDARIRRHQWEWITSGRDANSYLPFYTFQTPSKVTDIWTEYTSGLNGFLPVRDLEDTWGARWRRNNSGLKTEMGRRKKVIQLVEALVKKPNWNVPLAIRFLEAKYDNPSHPPRKFCEYLQKTPAPGELSGINAVLIVANAFT